MSDPRGPATGPMARATQVSPFAADSARKSASKPELSSETVPASGPRIVTSASSTSPVIMGSVAPDALAEHRSDPTPEVRKEQTTAQLASVEAVRNAVLAALVDTGHRMVVTMLETGVWAVEGNDLVVKVTASAVVIDMSLGNEARKVATAAASGALGRAVKMKVLPGGTAQVAPPRSAPPGGSRTRAEQDPIVRRLQGKFGAEIRTIIDQGDKK